MIEHKISKNDESSISRRQVIGFSLSGFLLTNAPVAFATTPLASELEISDVFLRLAQSLTGSEELTSNFTAQFLPYFLDEPWGEKHIRTAFQIIDDNAPPALQGPGGVVELLSEEAFPAGEKWFLNHLATTLYTGVYYHERIRPVQVTTSGALVWDIVDDLVTRPGQAGLVPGYWAEPPIGAEVLK